MKPGKVFLSIAIVARTDLFVGPCLAEYHRLDTDIGLLNTEAMKVYQVIFTAGFSILLLFALSCQKAETVWPSPSAENPALISRYVPGPGTSDCTLLDCETAIENARAELKKRAEEECGVFLSAIRCCEANQLVYLMYRYSADCEAGIPAEAPPATGEPGYADLAPSPIGIELLESHCINGGTALRIVLKDGALPLPYGPFEVHWWVDGQYQGNEIQIGCVSGKAAQLLIIDHWNDEASHWYKVDLHETGSAFRY